jgi:hypothetical protein
MYFLTRFINMVRHEGVDKDDPTKVTFTIDPDGLSFVSMDPNYTYQTTNKDQLSL